MWEVHYYPAVKKGASKEESNIFPTGISLGLHDLHEGHHIKHSGCPFSNIFWFGYLVFYPLALMLFCIYKKFYLTLRWSHVIYFFFYPFLFLLLEYLIQHFFLAFIIFKFMFNFVWRAMLQFLTFIFGFVEWIVYQLKMILPPFCFILPQNWCFYETAA